MHDCVAKFGGSSLRDATAINRTCSIIENLQDQYQLIVLSATFNSTNELEKMADNSKVSAQYYESFVARHRVIASQLELIIDEEISILADNLAELLCVSNLSEVDLLKRRDSILSYGERFSTLIVGKNLEKRSKLSRRIKVIDSWKIIKTDSNYCDANVDLERSKESICRLWDKEGLDEYLVISQGFLGSDNLNTITTIGREGSDLSATIYASALTSSEVHIWTDVAGVYNCDPNIVGKAQKLDYLSFDQAHLLASAGAKVLYSKTLSPIKDSSIKLKVLSSIDFNKEGTTVSTRPWDDSKIAITDKRSKDGIIVSFIGRERVNLNSCTLSFSPKQKNELVESFLFSENDRSIVLNELYSLYFH